MATKMVGLQKVEQSQSPDFYTFRKGFEAPMIYGKREFFWVT